MPHHDQHRSGRSSRRRKRGLVRRIQDLGSDIAQGISDFGRAVVWPIERLGSTITEKVIAASRGVDRSGSVFKRFPSSLGKLLLWPLRLVGRLLEVLLPKSLTRMLTRTGRKIRRFGKSLMQLLARLNLDKPVLWIGRKLKPLWSALASLGKFLSCWSRTRKYRRGLTALPALLLATLVLGITAWQGVLGRARVAGTYNTAVSNALESQDYEGAQLYERKLAQLGVDTKLTEYRTAVALATDGRLDEAYARMQLLAPTDEPGYASAHFWIAQQLLAGKLVEPGDAARRLTKVHLDHLETLKALARCHSRSIDSRCGLNPVPCVCPTICF